MAVFDDLTEYSYFAELARKGTKNIGWLGVESNFKKASLSDEILGFVWKICEISIAQTRGIHECPFCQKPSANRATRGSQSLLLGTSEIRVFSRAGGIFAAPTLVYHYMDAHHYCPPAEFLNALVDGLAPSSDEHLSKLQELDLQWTKTSSPSQDGVRFRFVKLDDQSIVKVVVEDDTETNNKK